MVNLEEGMTPENSGQEIAIAFRGTDAKTDADALYHRLEGAGLALAPPTETGQGQARLGASEIVITLLLAPFARLAAKAVIMTALKYMQEYLSERVMRGEANQNLQIVVKTAEKKETRFPLSLRGVSSRTIETFFENIRQTVARL